MTRLASPETALPGPTKVTVQPARATSNGRTKASDHRRLAREKRSGSCMGSLLGTLANLRGIVSRIVAVVGGDQVGKIGLVVAAPIVVPEDVRTGGLSAAVHLGGRARDLAVDDAFEHDLAAVGEDGDVHACIRKVLDRATNLVLGLVAAAREAHGENQDERREDREAARQGRSPPRSTVARRGRARERDRKSTRLNSSHSGESRMPSSA